VVVARLEPLELRELAGLVDKLGSALHLQPQ